MRPRARDKKLIEEWAVPLGSIEDIYEVELLYLEYGYIVLTITYQLKLCSLLYNRDLNCIALESWEAILGQN